MEWTCKLWVHEQQYPSDLVLNTETFPGVHELDVLEIFSPGRPNVRVIVQVPLITPTNQLKGGRLSLNKHLADTFRLQNRGDVVVRQVDAAETTVDFVQIQFKDQYLSRRDMWMFKESLCNQCAFVKKKVANRAQVREMVTRGQSVSSGLIGPQTRIVFRSATAEILLMIQVSSEMWEFDATGDLFYELAVDGFLAKFFDSLRRLECNHDITVVMFARCTRPDPHQKNEGTAAAAVLTEDLYRVVAQTTLRSSDPHSLVRPIKRLFASFTRSALLDGARTVVPAQQSCFLEAINLALNHFELSFTDRNLERIGQSIVVVSAGTGVYDVDRNLTHITKRRMMDSGIGLEVICVRPPPPHITPLIRFRPSPDDLSAARSRPPYNMPHWIHTAFYTEHDAHHDSSANGATTASAATTSTTTTTTTPTPVESSSTVTPSKSSAAATSASVSALLPTRTHHQRRKQRFTPTLLTPLLRQHAANPAMSYRPRPPMPLVLLPSPTPRTSSSSILAPLTSPGPSSAPAGPPIFGTSAPESSSGSYMHANKGAFPSSVGAVTGAASFTGTGKHSVGSVSNMAHSNQPLSADNLYTMHMSHIDHDVGVFIYETANASADTAEVRRKQSLDGQSHPQQRASSQQSALGGAGGSPSKLAMRRQERIGMLGPFGGGGVDSKRTRSFVSTLSGETGAADDQYSRSYESRSLHDRISIKDVLVENREAEDAEERSGDSRALRWLSRRRRRHLSMDAGYRRRGDEDDHEGDDEEEEEKRSHGEYGCEDEGEEEAEGEGEEGEESGEDADDDGEGELQKVWAIEQHFNTRDKTVALSSTLPVPTTVVPPQPPTMASNNNKDLGAASNNTGAPPAFSMAPTNTTTTSAPLPFLTSARHTRASTLINAPQSQLQHQQQSSSSRQPEEDTETLRGASYGSSPEVAVLHSVRAGAPPEEHLSRAPALNPFDPRVEDRDSRLTSNRRRWTHVFPTPEDAAAHGGYAIDWRSLCTPACLPLTTNYFPTRKELERLYKEGAYQVSIDDDDGFTIAADVALRELILQRLVQGFQMIVDNDNLVAFQSLSATAPNPSTASNSTTSTATAAAAAAAAAAATVNPSTVNPTASTVLPNSSASSSTLPTAMSQAAAPSFLRLSSVLLGVGSASHNNEFFMSMGKTFHRLSFDTDRAQSIYVTRFLRSDHKELPPSPYTYILQSSETDDVLCTTEEHKKKNKKEEEEEEEKERGHDEKVCGAARRGVGLHHEECRSVSFVSPPEYGWNNQDMVMCGIFNDIRSRIQSWRTRYVLVPHAYTAEPTLAQEEARMESFLRFLDILNRTAPDLSVILEPSALSSYDMAPPPVKVEPAPSTLGNPGTRLAAFAAAIGFTGAAPASPPPPSLPHDAPIDDVVSAMTHPKHGLPFARGRSHPHIVLGSDAVTWALKRITGLATMPSRTDAVRFLDTLVSEGRLQRLVPRASTAIPSPTTATATTPSPPATSSITTSTTTTSTTSAERDATTPPSPISFVDGPFFYRLVLALDSDTSDTPLPPRPLRASCEARLDLGDAPATVPIKSSREWISLFHDATYHPRESFSLSLYWLVATSSSVDTLVQTWSRRAQSCGLQLCPVPFVALARDTRPFFTPIRLPVPSSANIPLLLRQLGYLLDREGSLESPQYVHCSGHALVSIVENGTTILFVRNWLLTNRWRLTGNASVLAKELRDKLAQAH